MVCRLTDWRSELISADATSARGTTCKTPAEKGGTRLLAPEMVKEYETWWSRLVYGIWDGRNFFRLLTTEYDLRGICDATAWECHLKGREKKKKFAENSNSFKNSVLKFTKFSLFLIQKSISKFYLIEQHSWFFKTPKIGFIKIRKYSPFLGGKSLLARRHASTVFGFLVLMQYRHEYWYSLARLLMITRQGVGS